jgi:hypothetical protein
VHPEEIDKTDDFMPEGEIKGILKSVKLKREARRRHGIKRRENQHKTSNSATIRWESSFR